MEQSIDHREMERRSLDTVVVYNPTDVDIPVRWNGYANWVVPNRHKTVDSRLGAGHLEVPRYIGEKYVIETSERMINNNADKAVEEENRKRVNQLQQKPMDAYESLHFSSQLYAGPNNVEAKKHWFSILFKGVSKQYGYEPVIEGQSQEQIDNYRSNQELLASLNKPFTLPAQAEEETKEEVVAQPLSVEEVNKLNAAINNRKDALKEVSL